MLQSPGHAKATNVLTARPLAEWHEDMGPVMWWCFPITEPPYIGSPLDLGLAVVVKLDGFERTHLGMMGGWPGYHTHWTPLPEPFPMLAEHTVVKLVAAFSWDGETYPAGTVGTIVDRFPALVGSSWRQGYDIEIAQPAPAVGEVAPNPIVIFVPAEYVAPV